MLCHVLWACLCCFDNAKGTEVTFGAIVQRESVRTRASLGRMKTRCTLQVYQFLLWHRLGSQARNSQTKYPQWSYWKQAFASITQYASIRMWKTKFSIKCKVADTPRRYSWGGMKVQVPFWPAAYPSIVSEQRFEESSHLSCSCTDHLLEPLHYRPSKLASFGNWNVLVLVVDTREF